MATHCPKCEAKNPDTASYCADCGTQLLASEVQEVAYTKTLLTPVEDLTKGALFANRYEIIEELGKGGMGKVYKAIDNEIHEEVAIKLLKPEIAADEKIIERFRNELKIARKITHKNVCRTFHIGKEDGNPYITMEFVPGVDLKTLIKKKGKLPKEEALSIAKQVCAGLTEAHELGVVHRDLKPQNIMIDESGNAKIMDFGIARSLEAEGVTEAGMIIGTPDYISPEQAEGEEADQRSDIYSLGVILYEMVTGMVPFKGDTALSVALKHKSQLPQDPRKLNAEVADDLARLILICMEKDRGRRYQTAESLLSDLRNVEEGFPLGKKVRPRRETFVAELIRKRFFIPAVVVLLAVTAVLVWQWILRSPGPVSPTTDRPSVAILYFKNNTGDQSLDYLSETLPALMTIDLMQSKYFYVLPSDRLIQILNKLEIEEKGDYSTDELEKIADWGVVDHIIQGRYFKSGDDFRIFLQIQKSGSWEVLGTETLSGKLDLHARMVDELTPKIKSYFGLTEQDISEDIDFDIGQITTQSSEAFTYFLEGMKYYGLRDYASSLQSFKRAVDVDPQFAMAHIFLGWGYSRLGSNAESQEHIEKALSLVGRLSDRERHFVEAIANRLEKKIEPAIEHLKKILEHYPEDWLANFMLGDYYKLIEEWKKAHELFLENKRNKVDFVDNYVKLAITYKFDGLYDEAIKVCRDCIENISDGDYIRYELVHAYICKGKLDVALDEINKAQSLIPYTSYYYGALIYGKAAILMYMEDWLNEEKEIERFFEPQRSATWPHYGFMMLGHMYKIQGRLEESIEMYKQGIKYAKNGEYFSWECGFRNLLARLYLQTGNLTEALKEIEESMKLAEAYPMPGRLQEIQFIKGEIHLRMGSIKEAEKTAEEIKIIVDNGLRKKKIRYYYLLMGLIECKKNNFRNSEKYLKQALSLLPFQVPISERFQDLAVFYDAMATICMKLEQLDQAQENYEKIISFTTGRLSLGIIYAKSFYMLGKIFEQKGNTARAIEHYEKFLDLWKDADPGIAEVDDARERLAGLTTNQ